MATQKMSTLIPDRTKYSSDTSSGGSIHGGGPVLFVLLKITPKKDILKILVLRIVSYLSPLDFL